MGPLRALRHTSARSAAEPPANRSARPAPAPIPPSGAAARAAGRPARLHQRPVRPLRAATGGCVTCSATPPARSARNCRPSTRPSPATERPDTVLSWLGQERRPRDPAGPRTGNAPHPRPPRRAARRQAGRAPAQRPGRHRDAAAARRADDPAGAVDHRDHRRPRRPRRAAAAAPLRRLAPAAPAPPPHQRRARPPTTRLVTVRQHVRAAIALLDWLTARDLTLATARQGDLDTWLTSDDTTHRREAGHFVRWARRRS